MRWNKKRPPYFNNGQTRTVTRFLFFPMCLWNRELKKREYRWLEFVEIQQEFRKLYGSKGYWKERYWNNTNK